MSHLLLARVAANEPLTPGFGLLTLEAPEIAAAAKPGQFVMVRVAPLADPLLRRAFAVHAADRERGLILILYGVVGRGTRLLSQVRAGESLDVLGPLGRGWRLEAGREAWLVAGGFGAAPLLPLAQEAAAAGTPVRLFYGTRTAAGLIRAGEFERLGVEVACATEDGSHGQKGLVTDLLLPALMSGGIGPPLTTVYACGPKPMLAAVARLCAGMGVPCQVSLHAFMGCGIGACLGCAVERRPVPGEPPNYAKVCVEGPVFDAQEVSLE